MAAVEGHAGREHTDPQWLISLWLLGHAAFGVAISGCASSFSLYAYSRGISSAREVARQCEFEAGLPWLCGLQAISHRTLSGFRSGNKAALDDLSVQVLGMLSAEGLITLERVTLDGTKIKAHAGGNSFRRNCPLRGRCAPQHPRPGWRRSITRIEEPATPTAFKAKMATEEAQQIYAKRSQIAEFPHAWIKERWGLRQFRCRNRLKVAMEATWACLSYNLTRWFSLRRASPIWQQRPLRLLNPNLSRVQERISC